MLTSTTLEYCVFLIGVCIAVHLTLASKSTTPSGNRYGIVKYNYVLMALILSSFGKGFVFLLMIWNSSSRIADENANNFGSYDVATFTTIINIFVFSSNTLALSGKSRMPSSLNGSPVFLDISSMRAASLVIFGHLVKLSYQYGLILLLQLIIRVAASATNAVIEDMKEPHFSEGTNFLREFLTKR